LLIRGLFRAEEISQLVKTLKKTCNDLEIRHTSLEGLNIRCAFRKGTEEGPPLLLFNGIGTSLEFLIPLVSEIPELNVITYDVPGTGESHSPRTPWRMRHHAKLASELVKSYGFDEVDVLGVSWGGMLAQQFARQFPRMCRRLVLAATSAGHTMVFGKPWVRAHMMTPLRHRIPSYMKRVAPMIYGGEFRTNKDLCESYTSQIKPASFKGYYMQVGSVVGWSSLGFLHKLKQPTLVLGGKDDPITPFVNSLLLVSRIPNAELRVLANGHLFVVTHPKQVAAAVEDFLLFDRNIVEDD